jgi:phage baseplate assembly protein W
MATSRINRLPDYSDLDLDFLKHPTTSDVSRKIGDEAIKRSLRNIIFTNHYDRPFQSNIGSNIRKLLFDNANAITASLLKDAVFEVINNFEPRVRLTNVVVTDDSDNNGYSVRLEYIILNREMPVTTNLFLERIR